MAKGMMVMFLELLGGNEWVKVCRAAIGKEITALNLNEQRLLFTFADGSKIKLFDAGRGYCAERYMRSDDNIQYFVGSSLIKAEIQDGPITSPEDNSEVHEIQFLIITTSKGVFTIANHNEHNGNYGGFAIQGAAVTEEEKGQNNDA